MTVKIEKSLIEYACYEAGLSDEAIYEGYSGRCMYGDKCFGLTVDGVGEAASVLLAFVAEGGESEFYERMELAQELAQAMRTDSLGLQMIAYFPGYELEDDEA